MPCKNDTVYKQQDYTPCCKLNDVLKNKLAVILKVMKYSIQPVLFKEPLKDFLEVFDNLDFLGYNNFTKFDNFRRNLMEVNLNPRIYMCQFAGNPISMSPSYCDMFHPSLTNAGIGYSFNKANFWDIFSEHNYTKLHAKIYRPKGFNWPSSVNEYDENDQNQRWVYPRDNISFPETSGPAYGLIVIYMFSLF